VVDETRRRVYDLLRRIPSDGLPAVKQLFCTELNYPRVDRPLSYRGWPDGAKETLAGPPTLLARQASEFGDFDVIHAEMSPEWHGRSFPLSVTAERRAINQLLAHHPYALFIFSDVDREHWHLVNVRYDEELERRRVFRRIALGPQEQVRTAAERVAMLDLESFDRDLFGASPLAIQQRHDEAFDVEAVTKGFFTDYRRIFEETEEQVEGLEGEELRLFTQRLFNRLLFIRFLERKGWLTFEGRDDYLCALWEAHQDEAERDDGADATFHRDRLKLLFFSGLNNVSNVDMMRINQGGFLAGRIGRVPYLNGGLFEKEELDRRAGVTVPDAVFGPIFDELIYHYNFTVTESTPLDIEVAVDPEMLGKIFEELVTGRHETGSYYTPKPVVSFMCREALKGYLRDTCPREDDDVVSGFVDERDASSIRRPEDVLAALQGVRVCDHACGSGAYLVGMLRELVDLRQALFQARGVDPRAVYDKKLEIIQRNLYGVDIDPFAVNIARLRLWLSLTVDFQGEIPPPLPNLEFKIEVGDSLTGPAPGQLQPDLFHHQQVKEYFRLKGEFLRAHGPEKADLRRRIEALQAKIKSWAREDGEEGEGFDWAVTFAEVFAGPAWDASTLMGSMTDVVNATPGQMELAGQQGPAPGFDVVLTNPPYVRQELLDGELKETLKKRYPEVYRGTADLYVYFYARALHLLRAGGVGSFISSNKWLRAGYGKKLRQHMGTKATVDAIVDFGDLPLFEATAYPMVIVFQNEPPDEEQTLQAWEVEDLDVVDRLSEVVQEEAWPQPQGSLHAKRGWVLVRPEVLALLEKLRRGGTPLGQYIDEQFNMGLKTGLNRAFVIDQPTRDQLVLEDPRSAEVIKPWVRGRNVKRWQVEWDGEHLIAIQNSGDGDAHNPWGCTDDEKEAREIFQGAYPAIHDHLSQYEDRLRERWDQGKFWWELRACAYYAQFAKPKILYPDIAKRTEFAYDEAGFLSGNTTYFVPTTDLALLGILNSQVVDFFYRHISAMIQQDYLRFFTQYLEQVPIPTPGKAQREAIEALVRKLLDAEGQGPHVDEWERELNALVYEVYGLTEDEIAIVERETTAGGRNTR